MQLRDEDGDYSRDITWTMEYNDFNQLTKKYDGGAWAGGTERWSYGYDDNGNLVSLVHETFGGGVWSVSEEWVYTWNQRDQMTMAMKWAGSATGTDNVGAVRYEYCLSCDGALSKRFEYGPGTGASTGALMSGLRYEYDGLNLRWSGARTNGQIQGLS